VWRDAVAAGAALSFALETCGSDKLLDRIELRHRAVCHQIHAALRFEHARSAAAIRCDIGETYLISDRIKNKAGTRAPAFDVTA
jgi:hypothetical protein